MRFGAVRSGTTIAHGSLVSALSTIRMSGALRFTGTFRKTSSSRLSDGMIFTSDIQSVSIGTDGSTNPYRRVFFFARKEKTVAHDDMHVVMYKILAYLYDCMKRGVRANPSEIAHDSDMLGIPDPYWEEIMRELSARGYVKGVSFAKGGAFLTNPTVTLEGVEFMQENSMMAKALAFLKDAKGALPFI